jgi:LAO/AO transport system kinase
LKTGPRPFHPPPDVLAEGILAGNRTHLARGITLMESQAPAHNAAAADLLARCLPHSGGSLRLGITGVPGAGKSTFIESFGLWLCERGHRLAVLAVDPSSARTGGSILGDKTRMEDLSRHPSAFIRPSPSGTNLGGVAARTREAMLLCEAAGYDILLIETVGVGQSEVTVRSMTDCFILLQIAGAGDELQGIKKGIVELADLILVNKADGDNRSRAERARSEYARVLQYLQPATPDWKPVALAVSALDGIGLDKVWETLEHFTAGQRAAGHFTARRQVQLRDWFHGLLREEILRRALADRKGEISDLESDLLAGKISTREAIERFLG